MRTNTLPDAETESSFHSRIKDIQINRVKRDAHFNMGEAHYHPYYELYYLLTGQCRIFIGHTIYYLFPGDLAIISPACLHKVLYETNCPAERITVSFTPEFVEDFIRCSGTLGWQHVFLRTKRTLQTSIHTPIRSLLEQLWQESLKNDAYTGIQLKSLLFSLLVQLGRFQDLKQEPQILAQAEAAIQESARFIYEHYQENLSLKDVATIAHMSPSYFSKKFKESTGFGFKEYLINIRMQEAAHLLLSTAAPVTELAGICGFSDSNYFGDAFRKKFGISPREYRRQYHTNTI